MGEELKTLKKNNDEEVIVLLKAILAELEKLNKRSDEAYKDMHHELRHIKVGLERVAN